MYDLIITLEYIFLIFSYDWQEFLAFQSFGFDV